MARDFHEAFDLGDDESITSVDADGVALAGIQGLSEQIDQKDERIAALEDENDELREENAELRDRYDELADRVDALEDRLVEAVTD